jgi:PAS domain S-box-containing protein
MVYRLELMALIAFGAGVVAAGIALYFIFRALFVTRKNLLKRDSEKTTPEKKEKVEFVIDTFTTLIHKLKEKEDELEKLKGLAERRASTAEGYNEDILRCVGSGVITFNMEGGITTFNDAAEKIIGMKREDVTGLSCADAFSPAGTFCHLLDEALLSGKPVSRQEVELQKKRGGNIWVGLSISPLKDKDGKQTGMIIVFTDLTEIKMLREQGELKRRLAMLGEMSGGIAHELRNSMGAIVGYAKILSKKFSGDEPAQEVISTIISEINNMNLIIKELLNYGKSVTPSISLVDLKEMIRKAIDTVIGKTEDRRYAVDLIIPDLPPVYADEVLMRQALQNIIQNGIEAMPDGGRLRIEVRSQKSEVRSKKENVVTDLQGCPPEKGIEILISDSGVGIPQGNIDKIFLPFYTTKPRGTGMGLALVHKIILAHGGSIDVDSIEGKGTTFRIYLPS